MNPTNDELKLCTASKEFETLSKLFNKHNYEFHSRDYSSCVGTHFVHGVYIKHLTDNVDVRLTMTQAKHRPDDTPNILVMFSVYCVPDVKSHGFTSDISLHGIKGKDIDSKMIEAIEDKIKRMISVFQD